MTAASAPYYTSATTNSHIHYTAACPVDLPPWMRDNLQNEYRALMQRAQYLRRVLGIASPEGGA